MTAVPTITAEEQVALQALDEVLRVERLLAKKRRAYHLAGIALAVAALDDDVVRARWAVDSQAKYDDAAERLEREGLSRWAP